MTDPAVVRKFITDMARNNPGITYADMVSACRFLDQDASRVIGALLAEGVLVASGPQHRLSIPARRKR